MPRRQIIPILWTRLQSLYQGPLTLSPTSLPKFRHQLIWTDQYTCYHLPITQPPLTPLLRTALLSKRPPTHLPTYPLPNSDGYVVLVFDRGFGFMWHCGIDPRQSWNLWIWCLSNPETTGHTNQASYWISICFEYKKTPIVQAVLFKGLLIEYTKFIVYSSLVFVITYVKSFFFFSSII